MRRIALMAVFSLVLALNPPNQAATITYTETIIGSGTLGSQSFTNALITLTATADPGQVIDNGMELFVNNNTAKVEVENVRSSFFAGPTQTFVEQTDQNAGIRLFDIILAVQQSAFGTYDLKTSLTSVSGPSFTNPTDTFPTSAGNLSITSTTGNATFEATLQVASPIPEPSPVILGSLGALALVAARLRRE